MSLVSRYEGRLEQVINGQYKTGTEYLTLVFFGKNKNKPDQENDLLALTLIKREMMNGIYVSNCY